MRAMSPERARRTFMPSATLPAFIISFRGFVRIGASAIGSSQPELEAKRGADDHVRACLMSVLNLLFPPGALKVNSGLKCV